MDHSTRKRSTAYLLLVIAGFLGIALVSIGPDWGHIFQTNLLVQEGNMPPPMDMPPPSTMGTPPMDMGQPPPTTGGDPGGSSYSGPGQYTPPPQGPGYVPYYDPATGGTVPPVQPPVVPQGGTALTPPPASGTQTPTTQPPTTYTPPPSTTTQPQPQTFYAPPATSTTSTYAPPKKASFLQQFDKESSFNIKNYQQELQNIQFSPGYIPPVNLPEYTPPPAPVTYPAAPAPPATTSTPETQVAPAEQPAPKLPVILPVLPPHNLLPIPKCEGKDCEFDSYAPPKDQSAFKYAQPQQKFIPAAQPMQKDIFKDYFLQDEEQGEEFTERDNQLRICKDLQGHVFYKRADVRFSSGPGFAACVDRLDAIAQSCDPDQDNFDLSEEFYEVLQECEVEIGRGKMLEGVTQMRKELERLQNNGIDVTEASECLADIDIEDIQDPEEFEFIGASLQECGELIREAYEQQEEFFNQRFLSFIAEDIRRGLAELESSDVDEETKQACAALGERALSLAEATPIDELDEEERMILMSGIEDIGMEAEDLGCMIERQHRGLDDWDIGFDDEEEIYVSEVFDRFSGDKSQDVARVMMKLNKENIAELSKENKDLARKALNAITNLEDSNVQVDSDELLEQNKKLAQQVKIFQEKITEFERQRKTTLAADLKTVTENLANTTFLTTDPSTVASKCQAALDVAGDDEDLRVRIVAKCKSDTKEAIAADKKQSVERGLLSFEDMDASHWAEKFLKKAKEMKVFEGDRDPATGKLTGTVRPSAPVNTAELLKIAFKAGDVAVRDPKADETWYDPLVEVAKTLDLPQLAPSKEPNRAQVAKILMKVAGASDEGLECGTFKDVPESNPNCGAIEWLNKNGIAQGRTDADGKRLFVFDPNANVNRAEIAKMITTMNEKLFEKE